jgi:hypothetical protein
MAFNPDDVDDALSDGRHRNYGMMLKLIVPVAIAVAVGIMLIVNHRDSLNNALDTGNCLVEDGIHEFFASLKLFLHQAYRWIFKACG